MLNVAQSSLRCRVSQSLQLGAFSFKLFVNCMAECTLSEVFGFFLFCN